MYVGLNTNMFVESFHKKLKHHYLEGKLCTRLDKAINALFKFIRDLMFERIIKMATNKPTEKILKIRVAHGKSRLISNDDISQRNTDPESWEVKSQISVKELTYEVIRIRNECPDPQMCVLRCPDCKICVHSFQCSCMDNVIYMNICKHIHKVAEMTEVDVNESENYTREKEIHETMEMLETLPQPSPISKVEGLKSKCRVLMGFIL